MEEDICNFVPEILETASVDGKEIPLEELKIESIEVDDNGREVVTFTYKGNKRISFINKQTLK
jgi:ribosomal protein L22